MDGSVKIDQRLPAAFLKSARLCGLSHLSGSRGHFFVEKNKVLSSGSLAGVEMSATETAGGVKAKVIIKKGQKITQPLFFCFGLEGKDDKQLVVPEIILEEGAEVSIFAHCSFPRAVKAEHEMVGSFRIGKKAKFYYEEHHYHGEKSGATVLPKLDVQVAEGGKFQSNFSLSKGTVGKVNIEVEVHLGKNAQLEIETKVLGKGKRDEVTIIDRVFLEGEGSRSLIKMRAAAVGGGRVLMQGETYARAAGSIGHVDCQEIVSGQSVARAVPIVEVSNDQARVTHEASVGKVNQKELETLMTRGLSEEEASELIIQAMMR